MGFVAEPEEYELTFAEDRYQGLRVTVRSCSIADYFAFLDMLDAPTRGYEAVQEMFAHFAPYLVSWNLTTRDGEPLPTTAEALTTTVDRKLAQAIVKTWVRSVMEVDGPLDDSSTNGEPSVEASLPMEELSPSRAS